MRKVLFIQTAFIGDAILASGLLEKWHSAFPDDEIHLLVRKGNDGLFAHHPFLSKLLVWHKNDGKYKSLFHLSKEIRAERYDKLFNLQRFGATGLLAGFSGAKEIIGFKKNPFSFLFNKAFPHDIGDGTHEIERNHLLISEYTDNLAAKPKLFPSESDYGKVQYLKSKPYICLAPTSVWFTKQLPAEKWVELINIIPEDFKIYLLGAPSDKESCQQIIDASSRKDVVNLAGELTLLQSAALMKDARMIYANDSAPMHLASSMNAPTTAVFCSTIPDFGFGPVSNENYTIETSESLDCKPCGLHGKSACPKGHFKCGNTVSIDALLQPIAG